MKDDSGTRRPALSSGQEFAGLGLQFAGALALFGWLGWWLDRRLGTGPWLLILLIFVGAGAAFYSMYRRVFSASTSATRAKRPGREGEGDARRERDRR